MNNPRFPYKLSVKRARLGDDGLPLFDYDGTPTYDTLQLEIPVYFDGEIVKDANGDFVTESVNEIECGNRTNSRFTSTAGDVVVGQYTLHTPLILTEFKYGDVVDVTENGRTWQGTIVGKKNFNWGSNIYINDSEN